MTGDPLDDELGTAIAADGAAPTLSTAAGGPPDTTNSEKTSVMAATRVYSWRPTGRRRVSRCSSVRADAVVAAIPGGVLGGIPVILFGSHRAMVFSLVRLRAMRSVIAMRIGFGSPGKGFIVAGQAAMEHQPAVDRSTAHRFGIGVDSLVPGSRVVISMSMPRMRRVPQGVGGSRRRPTPLRMPGWSAATWSRSRVPATELHAGRGDHTAGRSPGPSVTMLVPVGGLLAGVDTLPDSRDAGGGLDALSTDHTGRPLAIPPLILLQ